MNPAPPLRLDGDLFQIYASYKKATNYVIRWLTASCTPGLARSCVSSVREMRHLANQIISSGIPIPAELITTFHKAIEARKRLASFYYRSSNICDHEVTETHAYFNETFAEIYKDLAYARKETHRDRLHSEVPPKDLSTAPSNLFEYLSSSDDSSEQSDVSSREPSDDKALPPSGDTGPLERGTANMPAIEGDALGELASIHAHLTQLDQLATTVEQSYHEAADGSIPLVVAALTSNCAYESSKSLGAGITSMHCGSLLQLKAQYTSLTKDLTLPGNHTPDAAYDQRISSMLAQLETISSALLHFKSELHSRKDLCCDSKCHKCDCNSYTFPVEDPTDYLPSVVTITSRSESSETIDPEFLDSILRGLYQDLQLCKENDARTLVSLPLLREFEAFMGTVADATDRTNDLDLCFGLCLLYRSYKSFVRLNISKENWSLSDRTAHFSKRSLTKVARLHALMLSHNFMATLKSTLYNKHVPCTCFQANGTTVVSSIIAWHNTLNRFVRTNRFDLLYQSPWVSGTHAMANLAQTSECGSNLWHYGYFVGTVLHMYNAMLHAELLNPTQVPVLEAVCKMYDEVLFLGNRSTHNVLSCWQRWGGSRIMRTPHARSGSYGSVEKKWRLCSVHDATHGSGYWKRSYSATKISIFSALVNCQYALTDDIMARVDRRRQNFTKHQLNTTSTVAKSTVEGRSPAEAVDSVKAAVLEEFQNSPIPVARINHFSFYHACMRVMSKISEANHEEKLGYICKCPAEICLKTCDVYLKNCLMTSGIKPELVDCKVCNSCLEYVLQEFGGVELDTFLWDASLPV